MITYKDLERDGWVATKQIGNKITYEKDGWVAHGNLASGTFSIFDPTGIQRPVPEEIPKVWVPWFCRSCFMPYDGKGTTKGMHKACYDEEMSVLL